MSDIIPSPDPVPVKKTPMPGVVIGQDGKGRFAPGNKLAKGNPHMKQIQKFRADLYKAITSSDWKEIVDKAIQQAKDGDRYARDFLFDRILGKSVQTIDATVNHGLDQNEALKQIQAFFSLEIKPTDPT